MSTNYYWIAEDTTCPHCKRRDPDKKRLHIGKSIGGWCFSLHVDPKEGITSLGDWIEKFQTGLIEDEYGERFSPDEMLTIITNRAGMIPFDERKWKHSFTYGPYGYADEADFHRKNDSQRGPNNLLRHKIGRYCVGHGEGTWDLINGEFS